MKRVITIACIICFANMLVAQTATKLMKPISEIGSVKHYTAQEFETFKSSKAYGDIFWSEDFGGGIIPADWTISETTGNGFNFIWSNDTVPGPNGQYVNGIPAFQGTSQPTGYLCLPADEYNTPFFPNYINLDAYAQLPVLNFDTIDNPMLVFEQYYRYYETPKMEVMVSTDEINWELFDVGGDIGMHTVSSNPDYISINLTDIVGGASTVYIKFHFSETSHYFWAIDEIKITEAPDNDLQIIDAHLTSTIIINGVREYHDYYSSIPTNHVTPIMPFIDLLNFGNTSQHDIEFHSTVTGTSGSVVYDQFQIEPTLLSDSMSQPQMQNMFYAIPQDSFYFSFDVFQSETDQEPATNTYDPIGFKINSDKVYARDTGKDSKVSPSQYPGGADGDLLGVTYFAHAPDVVESISVFIDGTSDIGTSIIGQLYKVEQNNNILIIESDEHIIQVGDLDNWLTLPLISANPSDKELSPNTHYIAAVEIYSGPLNLFLGSDTKGPHLYFPSTKLRLGTDWYWIGTMPLIRMNLSGEHLLPFITSIPTTHILDTEAYTYSVEAVDMSGLSLTLSATTTNPETNMTAVDNGDGTMTISTPVIETTTFSSSEFRILITVDNSVATNYQEVVVYVTPFNNKNELTKQFATVYPNPVSDECTVALDKTYQELSVNLYNTLGSKVKALKSNNSSQITLDLSSLPIGVYFIRLSADKNTITKRIVKAEN